jgi:hypothetical protein
MNYLLGTSAYSCPELLEKCIVSWDKHIDRVVYFDGYYYKKIFKSLLENNIIESNVNCILEPKIPDHIGVSGSWNRILRFGFEVLNKDYVIMVGSDTVMKPGFLDTVLTDLELKKPDFAVGYNCCFNCWAMSRKCYDVVGLWDENFFPAYWEDLDYHFRIVNANLTMIQVGQDGLLEHCGSSTIRTCPERDQANSRTFVRNKHYLETKWNGPIFTSENFKTPFNDPEATLEDWELQEAEYAEKRKIWKEVEDKLNKD